MQTQAFEVKGESEELSEEKVTITEAARKVINDIGFRRDGEVPTITKVSLNEDGSFIVEARLEYFGHNWYTRTYTMLFSADIKLQSLKQEDKES